MTNTPATPAEIARLCEGLTASAADRISSTNYDLEALRSNVKRLRANARRRMVRRGRA